MTPIHIVTGASSGVGRALCLELSRRGRPVLGIARRAEELARLRREQPEHLRVLSADVADPDGRARIAEWVRDRYSVATITHSAAIAGLQSLEHLGLQAYRELMAINLEAPLFLTQALLPHVIPGARILHLSSGAAHRPMAGNGAYCISKAGLLMAYRMWNAEFPGGEIICGSAMPGVVEGPMQDRARASDLPYARIFREFKASGRLIQPARVGEFLAWLLLSTTNADFMAQDWDIFDTAHHEHWLRGPLNNPAPT
jgi:NAD(P)-dependent dehydrogenase (short-subunit alcohol dehydrogenase family)